MVIRPPNTVSPEYFLRNLGSALLCRLPSASPFIIFGLLMNVLRFSDPGYEQKLEQLATHSSLFDSVIEERTRAIVNDVRLRGDEALLELTARFDGAKLRRDQLPVTTPEKFNASLIADDDLRETIEAAHRNIQTFSRKSLRKNWSSRNRQNGRVGEKFDPFGRVGIYIPGGTAPLVSTALMTVTLAKTAGCPEIVVCTPCNGQ